MRSFAPPSLLFWAQCMCMVLMASTLCVVAQATPTGCGQVFDGLTHGKFDLDLQFSTSTLAANWVGFDGPVLSYEWAIFSDAALPTETDFLLCRNQLRSLPDVQPWRSTRKEFQAVNNQLALVPGRTYYSGVRATLRSGEHRIAFSNGVKVISSPQPTEPTVAAPRLTERDLSDTSCPIDDDNRCRTSQISVAERLSKLYGPARYPDQSQFLFPTARDDDDGGGDDDDDDDVRGHPWIIAPIVGALLLLICLILLCLALLALLAKGRLPERAPREKKPKKEKAPKDAPMSFVEADEQKNYGMRDNVDAMDATTATVVEFPDTQIRRLSISHKDESLADVAGPKRGRAPHPIMDSASSSFRDYRNH